MGYELRGRGTSENVTSMTRRRGLTEMWGSEGRRRKGGSVPNLSSDCTPVRHFSRVW